MFEVQQNKEWPFQICIIGPDVMACAEIIIPCVSSEHKTAEACNADPCNHGVMDRAQVMCDALNQTSQNGPDTD